MLKWMRSSLPARAGFAVLLIAVLALASALSAGVIAWLSQDDAAAINCPGRSRAELIAHRRADRIPLGARHAARPRSPGLHPRCCRSTRGC